MAISIRVDVYDTSIPWMKFKGNRDYEIEFYNTAAYDITVTFIGAQPPSVDHEFTVEAGGRAKWFTVNAATGNGQYSYSTSGGGTNGNGGIEIDRD